MGLVEWLMSQLYPWTKKPEKWPGLWHRIALRAADIAEEELEGGACEVPCGSNSGQWIDHYLMGQAPDGTSVYWCAVFASYCVMMAADELGQGHLDLTLKNRRGAKRLGKTLIKKWGAHWVKAPRRGDLAIYHRGNKVKGKWTWRGHVRIVTSVSEDGTGYNAIGGNEKSRVRQSLSSVTGPRLVGFVRLGA